jgi:hypothetical protein
MAQLHGLAEIQRRNRSRTGSCGNEPFGARPDGSFSLSLGSLINLHYARWSSDCTAALHSAGGLPDET